MTWCPTWSSVLVADGIVYLRLKWYMLEARSAVGGERCLEASCQQTRCPDHIPLTWAVGFWSLIRKTVMLTKKSIQKSDLYVWDGLGGSSEVSFVWDCFSLTGAADTFKGLVALWMGGFWPPKIERGRLSRKQNWIQTTTVSQSATGHGPHHTHRRSNVYTLTYIWSADA